MQHNSRNVRRLPRLLLSLAFFVCLSLTISGIAQADGGVLLGTTTLLNSGDTARKHDLVYLGDGFTEDEQDKFNERVNESVAAFLSAHPIHAMQSAINVHRVNVSSPESGTDKFSTCNGVDTDDDDEERRTALDSGYCNGGTGRTYRCIGSSDLTLATAFAANAPDDDTIVVLVNDTGFGGCRLNGGTTVYVTLTSQFPAIVVHELGHAMFNLADEYSEDGDNFANFTGTEPERVNITIATDKTSLKWRDLVLPSTSIPTQSQSDCSVTDRPNPIVPEDIVGTFEGGNRFRCGIYRPQYDCRMRTSTSKHGFCSVDRREIIQTLTQHLGIDRAVHFDDLLVRNDHDGAFRGSGDIYMKYELAANERIEGRWPASGDTGIDTGDTKIIDLPAGVLSEPASGTSATLALKVRDSDWPDGDDTLRDDTVVELPSGGNFEIDERDYRLRGHIELISYRVLLDVLHIKNDHDGFLTGAGDIYVNFTVSNGSESVSGRWPPSGDIDINTRETRPVKVLAGAIPRPNSDNFLTVSVRIRDSDFWSKDDELGDDTFTFGAAENFGADQVVHVRDRSDYRLTLSIVGPPPPVID